jgi:hypothetical protein
MQLPSPGHCRLRSTVVKTNILNAVLGFGFLVTGLFAFFYPAEFFSLLGDYYGTFNYHFVKDAGIAFISSGSLLLLSLRFIQWRLPLTLGGALFVVLHGVFHLQMLIMGMATTPADIAFEVLVVISPSALAALLLVIRIRERAQNS